ncbi:hypothetical protein [Chitinimonas sp.]|uniref:hypothetical protein n=1 Tax=Chitinimonas sp. TaxID=1934313 RepID=UPI002F9435D7
MTDEDFLATFEAAALAPGEFNHRAHLRVAYLYLCRLPFLEACLAMRDGLRRFAVQIGKPGLYHETLTVAFMSLLAERIADAPGADWVSFADANPALFDRELLAAYYQPATLASEAARRRLVLQPWVPIKRAEVGDVTA